MRKKIPPKKYKNQKGGHIYPPERSEGATAKAFHPISGSQNAFAG